ncbi:MAG: hypothetical protein CM1200mP16_02530 [Nitrospina sp.]|nr:MAG: hypothetical protein CM1200mP16_02530 [Nitrospina sp.]
MKEAQEEEENAEVEATQQTAIEEGKEAESEENLTDEEKEALARKKAQEEGDAKDLAMKDAPIALQHLCQEKAPMILARTKKKVKRETNNFKKFVELYFFFLRT